MDYDEQIAGATRRLNEAEARVERQVALLRELGRKARPTMIAERLLATMVCTCAALRAHRDMLEQRRAHAERVAPTCTSAMADLSLWDAEEQSAPVDLEYWWPESARPN